MVTTEQDVRALFNRLNVNGDGLLSDLRTAVQEAVGSLLLGFMQPWTADPHENRRVSEHSPAWRACAAKWRACKGSGIGSGDWGSEPCCTCC
jgi:hypothetical protein